MRKLRGKMVVACKHEIGDRREAVCKTDLAHPKSEEVEL